MLGAIFSCMALLFHHFFRRVITLIPVLSLPIGSNLSATAIEEAPDDEALEEEISLAEMQTRLREARQEIARHVSHIKHLMHSSGVSFSDLEAKQQLLSEATTFLFELDETLGIRSNAQGTYQSKQVATPDLCRCIPPKPSTSHWWCLTPSQAVVPLVLCFFGLCWLKNTTQACFPRSEGGTFSWKIF